MSKSHLNSSASQAYEDSFDARIQSLLEMNEQGSKFFLATPSKVGSFTPKQQDEYDLMALFSGLPVQESEELLNARAEIVAIQEIVALLYGQLQQTQQELSTANEKETNKSVTSIGTQAVAEEASTILINPGEKATILEAAAKPISDDEVRNHPVYAALEAKLANLTNLISAPATQKDKLSRSESTELQPNDLAATAVLPYVAVAASIQKATSDVVDNIVPAADLKDTTRIAALEQIVAELKESNGNLRTNNNDLNTKNKYLTSENERLTSEKSDISKDFHDAQGINAALNSKIENLGSKLEKIAEIENKIKQVIGYSNAATKLIQRIASRSNPGITEEQIIAGVNKFATQQQALDEKAKQEQEERVNDKKVELAKQLGIKIPTGANTTNSNLPKDAGGKLDLAALKAKLEAGKETGLER